MYLRFDFDKNNPEEFFTEELPSLAEALALLFMTGAVIDSVSLEEGKIFLIETEEELELEEEKPLVTLDKVCNNCKNFASKDEGPGYCKLHAYSVMASDTCELWAN